LVESEAKMMDVTYHKTGVSSPNLESPTTYKKSLVLDDLSLRELVIELLGADGNIS
jgi:hypothetical protein